MPRKIFVEFPVRDLEVAKSFYQALGFRLVPELTIDERAYLEVEDNVALVLLSEARFGGFLSHVVDGGTTTMGDSRKDSQYLVCFDAESRAEVDDLHDRALAAGGSPWAETVDRGHQYCRSFTDPDGHIVEIVWVGTPA